jgi:hypothetical protein
MARLAEILPLVRSHGLKVSVDVLTTIGHHEENLENSLPPDWQNVVDPSGRKCLGCFCPADPGYLGYVRKLYAMIAEIKPDFIWIDDDVRFFSHKPALCTCFCDRCVANFSKETRRTYTRIGLADALEKDEYPFVLRRKWLEHNRTLLDGLLRVIERTVHSLCPEMSLGFMSGDSCYEGYPFERLARTLGGPHNIPVRWRPGGGFYSDGCLFGLVEKAHDMGRQIFLLPASVEAIHSEVKNFPYQVLKKSARATVLEGGAHMAAGATGVSFNILGPYTEPLSEFEPFFREIRKARPF